VEDGDTKELNMINWRGSRLKLGQTW